MKVYLVSIGEYSNYGIVAAVSTQDLAEELSKKYQEIGETSSVLEMEVDDPNQIAARVVTEWNCVIDLVTGALWDGVAPVPNYTCGHEPSRKQISWPGNERKQVIRLVENTYGLGVPRIHVTSLQSIEHARKLAVEARQKWLRKKGV